MFHALELLCDMMNYNLKIIAADDHARARSYKVQVKYGDPKNIMCLFKSYKNSLYAKIIFSTKTQCLLFGITYLTKKICTLPTIDDYFPFSPFAFYRQNAGGSYLK